MHQLFKLITALIAASLLPISMVFAQGISIDGQTNADGALIIDDFDTNGQSVKLSETNLVPSLRIDYLSIDNIFRTPNDPLESTRVIVSPKINWYAGRRLVDLRATYQGSFAQASKNAPDFADHILGFSATTEFNSKNRSTASISISSEHDDIGTGVLSNISESDPMEVAKTSIFQISAAHTYGSLSARGNLTGGLSLQAREFRNQPTFTEGRNLLRIEPFARFSYRASEDRRFVLGGQLSNISFDNSRNDRLDTTVFTGLDFAATGKLSGVFRIGATRSSFANINRSDETSIYVDADFQYSPSDLSELRFGIQRQVDNSRGSLTALDSAIDTTLNVSWNHQWSSRISTRASVGVAQFDAICPQPSDVVTTPSFELEFALRRWITFGLRASTEQRRVSGCMNTVVDDQTLADFERQEFGMFVRGSL